MYRDRDRWRCAVKLAERMREYRNDPEYRRRQAEYKRERYYNDPEYRRRGDERGRNLYWARKDKGVCTKCGGPLLSETRCWGCLNRQEDHRVRSLRPRAS